MKRNPLRLLLGAGALSTMMALGVWTAQPAIALPGGSQAHHGHAAAKQSAATAYLLVAPDRGFLGNVELQDSFQAFAQGRNATIVYTTDDRTRHSVSEGIQALVKAGAKRVVVLPFFLSNADPGYQHVQSILRDRTTHAGATITWGRPFGESYFAVDMLGNRLQAVSKPAGRTVIVVGTGATDNTSQKTMKADLQRVATLAAEGMDFGALKVVVAGPQDKLKADLEAAVKGSDRPVIVPFHLGKKLDGMMSFDASVKEATPKGVEVIEGEIATHAAMPLWFGQEAHRGAPIRQDEIGVILMAHGSDYHWNRTMIEAVRPLTQRYMIEPALSMADSVVTERAVRRLESRGAKAIVIVRVFGLNDSFKRDVEHMIGADVAAAVHHQAMGHHVTAGGHGAGGHGGHGGHGGGHGGHGAMATSRILSSAVMSTVGGLDAHPFFAEALLDRANALSKDAGKETVILVAHGTENDQRNAEWQQNLETIAATMRAKGGSRFRAIKSATWREDWPDKREPSIVKVRQFVQDAGLNGGRAIVIPARTTAQGPEKRLLEGLTFEHGSGFAPHPKFVAWFEAQIKEGIAALDLADGSAGHAHH